MPRRITDSETVHVHLRLPARPGTAPRLRFDRAEAPQPEIIWLPDDVVARIVAARQITHTDSEATAAEIAERYQLVTDHTNLLLVFQRAESEKTDGMPALRQVQPMVAAGAGGVGRVRALSGLRTGTDSWPMSVSARIETPAVWRNARTKEEALASSGMDEIEIPAFLRRGHIAQDPPAPGRMRFGVDRGAGRRDAAPAKVALSRRQAAFAMLRTFNDAVQPGLSFRQVLRSVTDQVCDPQIRQAVESAAAIAGSQIKAWACFLMWVHELNAPEARLSDAALALVQAQLQRVDAQQQQTVMPLFELATA
jgi:hypothetical protein